MQASPTYETFLHSKRRVMPDLGFEVALEDLPDWLYDFQKSIVRWGLRKGRCAFFADTGMGKTRMQLAWANEIIKRLNGRILIVAPFSVVAQTVMEAEGVGLRIVPVQKQDDVDQDDTIYITNYEQLDKFEPEDFIGVVLDESSILKNITGKTRTQLIEMFQNTSYRLCCSATPAPNDVTELSNHATFLGLATPQQVTSRYFVHEAGVFQGVKDSRWRLKQHAAKYFYMWLSSWSIAIKKPSDLGFSDEGYHLPDLAVSPVIINSDYTPEGMLFFAGGISATDSKRIQKGTMNERIAEVVKLVESRPNEQWVIWTLLNDEGTALEKAIPGSVNVEGSDKGKFKTDTLKDFQQGKLRVLITKGSIAGFGINMQNAHLMAFCGLDYSWESYYQQIRRMWRHGQKNKVEVYLVFSNIEQPIFQSVLSKEEQALTMTSELIAATRKFSMQNVGMARRDEDAYEEDEIETDNFRFLLGDSCQRMKELPDHSVDLTVTSPPFSDMYVYNDTPHDLSNSDNMDEFLAHYRFIVEETLRITKPRRILVCHVQDPKVFKNVAGFRGLLDFPGDVVRLHQEMGWIYRSRITIDKNPQIVASRNKDNDLLFVTGKRDSTNLAPMATDYLLVFKAPGDNEVPVTPYSNGQMTEDEWIEWAHAVWYGIKETDVLNVSVARDNADEKHMCPLQLPVIDRCVRLWSNPGEVVFDPFGGIGSTPYQALKLGRRGMGIELKRSYFKQAVRNCEIAEQTFIAGRLF